jgi:ABC-type glycerol-3-phosphate transport system substrate-binding protein
MTAEIPVGSAVLSYNPLYIQVKDILLKRMVDGAYRPGEAIPSEAKLATDFGTSISTIRQALSILVSEGYLVKKQGKGTYVSERKTEISFLSWIVESKYGERILTELLHMFEERNPAIKVKIIPTTYPETRKQLMQMISEGTAPDVAQIVSHWTSYFAAMGAFAPMHDLLQQGNLACRFDDKDISGGLYQDRIYSVSWGLCPVSLIANKKVLRDAGMDRLDDLITLDDFSRICRQVSDESGRYGYGLCISGEESDFLRIYTFLQAFHGGFVNAEGEVIFNSPQNVQGFAWLREFVKNSRVCVADIYTLRKHFASGKIAFISDGPWVTYLLEEETGDEFEKNFQVILNPVHHNGISHSWNYNHALAICSQSSNKIYAAKLIDELTNGGDLSSWYYTRVGHLHVNRERLNESKGYSECMHAFRRQLQHATVINAQNSMFEKAMVLCIDAVKKILFQSSDIEDELSEKQYYLKMLYYG